MNYLISKMHSEVRQRDILRNRVHEYLVPDKKKVVFELRSPINKPIAKFLHPYVAKSVRNIQVVLESVIKSQNQDPSTRIILTKVLRP